MTLVIEHTFKNMRMQRIWAGQAFPDLHGWNKSLESIEYKTDAYIRSGFLKGKKKAQHFSFHV
jgi:hypothetical protein